MPGALSLGSETGLTDIVVDSTGIRLMVGTTIIQLAPAAISLTAGASAIAITPASVALGAPTAAEFLALASKVDAYQAADAIWKAAHTHTSTSPGVATSPPLTPPPTPVPTGSLHVKADL
jgi:hypothetical protein